MLRTTCLGLIAATVLSLPGVMFAADGQRRRNPSDDPPAARRSPPPRGSQAARPAPGRPSAEVRSLRSPAVRTPGQGDARRPPARAAAFRAEPDKRTPLLTGASAPRSLPAVASRQATPWSVGREPTPRPPGRSAESVRRPTLPGLAPGRVSAELTRSASPRAGTAQISRSVAASLPRRAIEPNAVRPPAGRPSVAAAASAKLSPASTRLSEVRQRLGQVGQARGVSWSHKAAGQNVASPARGSVEPRPSLLKPPSQTASAGEFRKGTSPAGGTRGTPRTDGPSGVRQYQAAADPASRLWREIPPIGGTSKMPSRWAAVRPAAAPSSYRQSMYRSDSLGQRGTIRIRDPRPGGDIRGRSGFGQPAHERFADRYQVDQFRHLTESPVARQLNLAEQYRMYQRGDVARRMSLHGRVSGGRGLPSGRPLDHRPADHRIGSWSHYVGRISPLYLAGCFRYHCYGPWYFASSCWYPRWDGWVDWSWQYYCDPLWDPRPLWCRPVVYVPCQPWVWWECPVWSALPVVPSGTWVDVDPVVIEPAQFDLQLLAVRFVDPGHPDQKLGPRYRVWFRNNSQEAVNRPFDVVLVAADDERLRADLPQAGVRVTGIGAGETQSVDIRLPFEVYQVGRNEKGGPAPLGMLHVLVDANRELPEVFEANNGARIAQADVLPVDPAAFELEPEHVAAGAEVLVAGEGFGPEPGRVLVHLGGLEMDGEILGWYDLGVRLVVPKLPLAGPTDAELIVIRGDGAAANPLKLTITPPQAEQIVPPPAPKP
jgi:hypothetical protein